jgi:ABC-type Zn2+ transport system substrate-binding protein/surface adhesin
MKFLTVAALLSFSSVVFSLRIADHKEYTEDDGHKHSQEYTEDDGHKHSQEYTEDDGHKHSQEYTEDDGHY